MVKNNHTLKCVANINTFNCIRFPVTFGGLCYLIWVVWFGSYHCHHRVDDNNSECLKVRELLEEKELIFHLNVCVTFTRNRMAG